jgi:hypothetical protein
MSVWSTDHHEPQRPRIPYRQPAQAVPPGQIVTEASPTSEPRFLLLSGGLDAAAWHYAIGEYRMHYSRAAAEPAGDRAQNKRHESYQLPGRDRRSGGVRSFGRGLLRLCDRLLILLLEGRDLLARLLERDVVRAQSGREMPGLPYSTRLRSGRYGRH